MSGSTKKTQHEEMDYPNPDQLLEFFPKGKPSLENWEEVSKIMHGPMCWKCFLWGTFFTCQKCGRHYHRECAFMGPGFPEPRFNSSVQVAAMAAWNTVKLLECPCCLVAEKTQVSRLAKVSTKDLNTAFHRAASHFCKDFKEYLEPLTQHFGPTDPNVTMITEKASQGSYMTVEGFYGDYKYIMYKIVSKYSKESEAYEVAAKLLNLVAAEITTIISCMECYLKRWNSEGKILSLKEYIPFNVELCKVPHPVIWVKETKFPYWPAKLLAVDNDKVIVQCFREEKGAIVRVLQFHRKNIRDFKKYSLEFPGGKKPQLNSTWNGAIVDCNRYLENAKAQFGDVVVSKEPEPFDGDEEEVFASMFPLYNKTK